MNDCSVTNIHVDLTRPVWTCWAPRMISGVKPVLVLFIASKQQQFLFGFLTRKSSPHAHGHKARAKLPFQGARLADLLCRSHRGAPLAAAPMAPKRKPKPPQTFHPHALVAEAHAKSIGLDAAADPAAFQFLCKERESDRMWEGSS